MPINRDKHGEFSIECSLCEDTEELPDAENFNEAVQEAKAEGWIVRPDGSGWLHICPDCGKNMP